MQLAVFPLPIFLLPGGVTRLRIFEQRYLRMVKEAAGDKGFALTAFYDDLPNNVSDWATWVKIVNFETLPEGLLAIDVKAEKMLSISNVTVEPDGLRQGTAKVIEHWRQQPHSKDTKQLATSLANVYQDYPELAELYPQPQFDNATWVCQRWLEIVPLANKDKSLFVQEKSYQQAFQFLRTLVLAKK